MLGILDLIPKGNEKSSTHLEHGSGMFIYVFKRSMRYGWTGERWGMVIIGSGSGMRELEL
jgi:hypothetical protein